MINNSFKQISIPNKKYTIEDLTTDFLPKLFEDEQRKAQNLNTIRPYKIMVSAPANTWLYFNNDISPVIINETGKFIWDLSSFGTFNSLYFVFNDSKYLWDSDKAVWTESQEGLAIETIWKELTGYDISAIASHSDNIIIAIFSAVLLTRINELEDATIDTALADNITSLQNLFQSNINEKEIGFEEWLKQLKGLLNILENLEESELNFLINKRIVITGFYYDLKNNE